MTLIYGNGRTSLALKKSYQYFLETEYVSAPVYIYTDGSLKKDKRNYLPYLFSNTVFQEVKNLDDLKSVVKVLKGRKLKTIIVIDSLVNLFRVCEASKIEILELLRDINGEIVATLGSKFYDKNFLTKYAEVVVESSIVSRTIKTLDLKTKLIKGKSSIFKNEAVKLKWL